MVDGHELFLLPSEESAMVACREADVVLGLGVRIILFAVLASIGLSLFSGVGAITSSAGSDGADAGFEYVTACSGLGTIFTSDGVDGDGVLGRGDSAGGKKGESERFHRAWVL